MCREGSRTAAQRLTDLAQPVLLQTVKHLRQCGHPRRATIATRRRPMPDDFGDLVVAAAHLRHHGQGLGPPALVLQRRRRARRPTSVSSAIWRRAGRAAECQGPRQAGRRQSAPAPSECDPRGGPVGVFSLERVEYPKGCGAGPEGIPRHRSHFLFDNRSAAFEKCGQLVLLTLSCLEEGEYAKGDRARAACHRSSSCQRSLSTGGRTAADRATTSDEPAG